MEIFITMCVNSTNSDVICKPTEEIYNFIETIGFALDFKEVSFDLNNYDNPLENTLYRMVYTIFNPNISMWFDIFMTPIEFVDSKNVLYQKTYHRHIFSKITRGLNQFRITGMEKVLMNLMRFCMSVLI